MADILNQNFASDEEEEEDEDFNPAPALGSDDEADEQPKTSARPKAQRSSSPGDEKIRVDRNGEASASRTGNGLSGDDAQADESDAQDSEEHNKPRQKRNEDEGDEDDLDNDDEAEAEEDLDDEDEEEDEDEAVTGRPRKRRRRGGLNQFFEEEAEVDEDDDAEDEEDELGGEFVADTHPDDIDAEGVGADIDDRRHRELDRQRELEQSLDAEKQAEMLRERYGRRTAAVSNSIAVPKRLLLPSVEDPSIYGVQCKPGKEREVVFNIMKKYEERLHSKRPMRIFSAFERGGAGGPMQGFIYIEARTKVDVLDAIEGLMHVYPRGKNILVPVKEMPDLLRVQKSEELSPGGWVRIKRGKYAGDLAEVVEVETNGLEVTVRLVPRLDYGLNEDDKNAPITDASRADLMKRKRMNAFGNNAVANRPPQRLFSEAEAKKKHTRHLTPQSGLRGKQWLYFNDTYNDGFLIKDMKINHLITQNVNPKLDEVTMFARRGEGGTDDLDLESLAQSLKNSTAEDSYLPGDHVEVYEGEQRGITGKTVSVRANIVTVQVTDGELAGQTVDVPIKGLRKKFRDGDHVKVIGGSRYRDEVGMVVRIKDDRVTVLTDMSMQEITVFSKDLREAADAGVDGKVGKYDVHDLIQLDPATVACVIKVDRESLRVLDQNGSVRSILPSQVTNKIEARRDAIATDRNGSEIRVGDTVREVVGESKHGTILHIYRSFLFVHSRTLTENSGVFVVRSTNVATIAAKGGRQTGGMGIDITKMNPAMKNGSAGAMLPPKTFGRDRTVGKAVTIRKGVYKGMLGIVKDATETTARVELHAKNKIITVDKDLLMIKDPITGQNMDMSRFGGRPGGGGRVPYGGSTPGQAPDWSAGARTPAASGDGGRTPAWGSSSARTPAWGGGPSNGSAGSFGNRTPSWKQSGSQTAYGGASGGMTSYGGQSSGGGGRTPAWSSSNRTPYGADHGFSSSNNSGFDSFASGSRTPAYTAGASGGRTPAWGTTPKPYDAPTPAPVHADNYPTPYASAPTPGASAPTPRFPTDAPTPRVYDNHAPTPAASGSNMAPLGNSRFDAPTPAASGYGIDAPTPGGDVGGGPRYIDSDEE